MRLTTRGRYAVTAMMDIAIHDRAGNAVSVVDIAHRQNLSPAYLEKLLTTLRRQHLVVSMRGPRGGYRLSKTSHQISIRDIIRAVDEGVDATLCRGKKNCFGNQTCLTHNLWEELSRCIENFLSGITLADAIRLCLSSGVMVARPVNVNVKAVDHDADRQSEAAIT